MSRAFMIFIIGLPIPEIFFTFILIKTNYIMKKTILHLALLLSIVSLKAQITYNFSKPNQLWIDKLTSAGYKYIQGPGNSTVTVSSFNIYNLNNTLYKTVPIPPPYNTMTNVWWTAVSDNLFNTNSTIEYLIGVYSGSTPKMAIIDEFGSVLFSKDSAWVGIYFDGTNARMLLTIQDPSTYATIRTDVYTLPGSIPCQECTGGVITNMTGNSLPVQSETAKFYPNPTTGQLKLKYSLPKDYKTAMIQVRDMQGRLLQELQVTDAFDFIYMPSNFNNGMYIYSLIVDGKNLKTEKIVLSK
jgi:hypothetical protein